jgi:hypothetical protein
MLALPSNSPTVAHFTKKMQFVNVFLSKRLEKLELELHLVKLSIMKMDEAISLAVCMSHHPRLGNGCRFQELPAEILHDIVDLSLK